MWAFEKGCADAWDDCVEAWEKYEALLKGWECSRPGPETIDRPNVSGSAVSDLDTTISDFFQKPEADRSRVASLGSMPAYTSWHSSLSFRFSQSGITRSSRSKKAPP
jgi:hypothetical protein